MRIPTIAVLCIMALPGAAWACEDKPEAVVLTAPMPDGEFYCGAACKKDPTVLRDGKADAEAGKTQTEPARQ